MEDNSIQEYQRLVEEIGRYQEQIFTTFIYAVTAAGTLFALAYSEAIAGEFRWIILFTPWVIMFPCVLLQAQRLKATWLIGSYLKNHLEPRLGLQWTKFITTFYKLNKRSAKGSRKFLDYGMTSSLALIVIQTICPILAILQRPDLYKWLATTVIVFASILMQVNIMYKAKNSISLDKNVQDILEKLRQETPA